MSDDKKDIPTAAPWPPTDPVQVTPRDGFGITRLDTNGPAGEEGILSKEPDADGWFTGHVPGFSQQIGIREVKADGQSWWETRVGSAARPYRYLNRTAAQQGALAELQRLKIAGEW